MPEVRHVIHLDVPRTLEAYYQEIGRAGRDNKPAKATLYYNGSDIASNKPGMTDEMRSYCILTDSCLRDYVLSYLGSSSNRKPTRQLCCSNCLTLEELTKEKRNSTGNLFSTTDFSSGVSRTSKKRGEESDRGAEKEDKRAVVEISNSPWWKPQTIWRDRLQYWLNYKTYYRCRF